MIGFVICVTYSVEGIFHHHKAHGFYFLDTRDILYVEVLPQRVLINAGYYCMVIDNFVIALRENLTPAYFIRIIIHGYM